MSTIKAETLERWHELDSRRKELEREARQLVAERDLLSTDLQASLEAMGKDQCTRGAYRVSLVEGRAVVAWKDEFVRRLGAELAAKLAQEAVPGPKRIQVEEISK